MQNSENNLTKDNAARIMASRKLITQPGKYHVRVTNDVQYLAEQGTVHRELAGGLFQVSIANFAACTPYHVREFKKAMKEGDYDGAANNNLTASVRENDYMPSKNEVVVINVDYITTKNGEQALLVTSFNPLPVSAGGKISMEDLLAEDEDDRVELKTEEEIAKATSKGQPSFAS
jgi:hypothetical protein